MANRRSKKSELFKKYNCQVIPYGLDVNLYNRRNKLFARQIMAVDEHKTVILFVAASVENSRKGFAYLKSALELVDRKDVLLCAIGSGTISIGTNVEVQHLGEIGDERFMSIIYSLADVFVIPSLMDNLPNTVLESLLCGTPVIGFPIGGIVDMIDDGKNGFLTKSVSVAALKDSLHQFLSSGVDWSNEQIREEAVIRYDQSLQAKRYIEIFNETLKNQTF